MRLVYIIPQSHARSTYLVDLREHGHLGPVQHSERQADHLQVLAAGGCGDVPGLGAHIVYNRLLQPGNKEVGSLVDNTLLDTTQTVEDDGAAAAFDIVEGGLGETDASGKWDGEAVQLVESVGGHPKDRFGMDGVEMVQANELIPWLELVLLPFR